MVGCPTLLWQFAIKLQGISFEAGKVAADAVPLACSEIICVGIKHLGCHTAVVLGTQVEQMGCLRGILTPHDGLAERLCMLLHKLLSI